MWSWDITYLRSPIKGTFWLLYMVVDVWSRKVVAARVHDHESDELASALIADACRREGIDRAGLVVHSDNGPAMKGQTLLAKMQTLGIVPSFSRPRVSDDNPFSEALFRTMKYRPDYPDGPFVDLEAAQSWVDRFVRWYNEDHQHSGIRFVTPAQRHDGSDIGILANRHRVYCEARKRSPQRWSGNTRDWSHIAVVRLNPRPASSTEAAPAEPAAQRTPHGAQAGGAVVLAPRVNAASAERSTYANELLSDNYLDTHRCRLAVRVRAWASLNNSPASSDAGPVEAGGATVISSARPAILVDTSVAPEKT